MNSEQRAALRRLIAACEDPIFDAEGDAWLYRPDPDTAYLAVDGLVVALASFFDAVLAAGVPDFATHQRNT